MVILNRSRTKVLKKVELDIWNFCLLRPFKFNNVLKKFYKEKFLILSRDSTRLFDNLFLKADRKLRRIFLRKRSYFGKVLMLKRRLYIFFGFLSPYKIRKFFLNIYNTSTKGNLRDNLCYIMESLLLFFTVRLHFFLSPFEALEHIKIGLFKIDGEVCLNPFFNISIGSILTIISMKWKSFFFKRIYIYWYNEYIRIGGLTESSISLAVIRFFMFMSKFKKLPARYINVSQFDSIKFFSERYNCLKFSVQNSFFSNGMLQSSFCSSASFTNKSYLTAGMVTSDNILSSLTNLSFNIKNFMLQTLLLKFYYALFGLKKLVKEFYNNFLFRFFFKIKNFEINSLFLLFFFKFFFKYLIFKKEQKFNSEYFFSFYNHKVGIITSHNSYGYASKCLENLKVFYIISRYILSIHISLLDNNLIYNNMSLELFRFLKRFFKGKIRLFSFFTLNYAWFKWSVFFSSLFIIKLLLFLGVKTSKKAFLFFNFFLNFWFNRQPSRSFSLWSVDNKIKLYNIYEFYKTSLKKRRNLRYLRNKLYDDCLWRNNIDSKSKLFSLIKINNRKNRLKKMHYRKTKRILQKLQKRRFSTYFELNRSVILSKRQKAKILRRRRFFLELFSVVNRKFFNKRVLKYNNINNNMKFYSKFKERTRRHYSLVSRFRLDSYNLTVVVLLELLILFFYYKINENNREQHNLYAYYKKNIL